jgi:hypothetical protein
MIARTFRTAAALALAGVLIVAVVILLALGRPPICTCGAVALWGHVGPEQSQMLADWYSASHIVHGFLFYLALRYAAPRWPFEWRFLAALIVEAAWEIVENTPLVIDRYREATIALGYSGDSILNSASDIVMMALGFLAALARRAALPRRAAGRGSVGDRREHADHHRPLSRGDDRAWL